MAFKVHFPKWVFHPSASPRIVESQEEQDGLSEEWVEHPSQLKPLPEPGEETEDALASATKPKSRKKK